MASPGADCRRIGRFRVLEKLGEGGMGVVFRAYDEELRRPIALKVLRPEISRDPASRTRIKHEASTLAQLNHPNIATVYDYMIDGPDDVLVMEFVAGESLADRIARGPLPVADIIRLGVEICSAVHEAHQQGIIHCDLKPGNIMLNENGHAKVLDFGLARSCNAVSDTQTLESTGSGGTLPYMSPEQLRGVSGEASDIYAIGVVLYELATRVRAFPQQQFGDLVTAILHETPALPSKHRPELPRGFDAVIARAIAKVPEKRFGSAAEFGAALQALVNAPASSASVRMPQVVRSRTAIVAGVLLIILAAAAAWYFGRKEPVAHTSAAHVVVVLPFESVGAAEDDEALCRGLTEVLTASLARASLGYGWQVVPASEVRLQKVKDAEHARRLLGANLVIEGSWQFAGARQVTFGLVDAANRRHLDASIVPASADFRSLETEVIDGAVRMLTNAMPDVNNAGPVLPLDVQKNVDPKANQYYVRARGYLQNYQSPQAVDAAIALLNSAAEADPKFAEAEAALGEAYWRKYELSKQPTLVVSARDHASRAAGLAPDSAQVLETLGLIDHGTGKYEQAVSEFERAVRLDPTDELALRGLANTYKTMGRNAEAERTYRRAIELRKDAPGDYYALGVFLYGVGRYDDAASTFSRALELAPENPRTYSSLGGVYYAKGDYAQARTMFEKSNAITPNYRAYTNLGTIDYFEERFEDAARDCEKALALDAHDYRVWHNLAASYHWVPGQQEKSREAYAKTITMIEAELKVNSQDADLLMLLADSEAMLGNTARANELAARSLKLAPEDVGHRLVAAEIYEQQGKRDEALNHLRFALQKGFSRTAIEHSPALKGLRADPRYQQLIANYK